MTPPSPTLKLYGYFRSSAAYRVRIALNLKLLPYDSVSIHLLKGEQRELEYGRLNPEKLVPLLEVGNDRISQSLAIIEYLEEAFPKPALLPTDRSLRGRVRAFALAIACEIHPLNNLRVLQHLTGSMGLSEAAKDAWYQHWIREGLSPLEQIVAANRAQGSFCFGNSPTVADVFLVPQLANARRTKCDLGPYPTLVAIEEACLRLEAFQKAAPEHQLRP